MVYVFRAMPGRPRGRAARTPKAYSGCGIAVSQRPWFGLTENQKELRLDLFAAWHERDIWAEDLLASKVKRVRTHAENASADDMLLLVRAWKMGVDLAAVSMAKLRSAELSKLKKMATDIDPQGRARGGIGGSCSRSWGSAASPG